MYLSGNILSTVPLKIYNLTTLSHRLLFQTSLNDVLDLHFGDIFSLYPGDYFLPPAVKYLYEVVNLTDSKSDDNKDQFVKLRFGR